MSRLDEIHARLDSDESRRNAYSVLFTADLRDLLAVVEEARNVLQAHDEADSEMDWTGLMVDLRLRKALSRLDDKAA